MAGRDARLGAARRGAALAPLSIVQAVLSGGWCSSPCSPNALRFPPRTMAMVRRPHHGRRPGRHRIHRRRRSPAAAVSLAALIAVEAAIFALGARSWRSRRIAVCCIAPRHCCWSRRRSAVRRLRCRDQVPHPRRRPLHGLLSPWTLTALVAGVIAFYASARSLQLGPPVEVIALTRSPRTWPPSSAASSSSTNRSAPAPRDRRPLSRLLPRHRRCGAHADARRATRARRERTRRGPATAGPLR